MKRTFILTTVSLFAITLFITSCGPSRVWATKEKSHRNQEPPPPSRNYASYSPSVSLIISPTPGFRMSQYSDGRYYHRNQQGLLYWKGYDNRFYLDRNYLYRVSYNKWVYKEWKRYSKNNGRR